MEKQIDKNLISEVKRIKKIMGIINEAPITNPRNIRPVIEAILEKFGYSKAEIRAESAAEGLVEKFEKTLRESGSGNQSIMSVMDDIALKFTTNVADGKNALKTFMRNPGVYETFAQYLKTSDPLKFQLKANTVVNGVFGRLDRVRPGTGQKLIKEFNGDGKKIFEFLRTNGALKATNLKIWFENYSPKIVGGVDDVKFYETFLRGLSSDKAAAWVTIFKNTFKSAQTLQEEFIALSKGAEQKIARGEDASEEFKKMGEVLISTKKWFNQLPKNLYDGIGGQKGWKDYISPEIRELIEKDTDGFKKLFDEAKKKHSFFEPVLIELNAYRKAWPFRLPSIKNIYENPVPGRFIFKKWDHDFLKRWVNILVIRDPRRFSEMYSALMARGSKGSLLANSVVRLTIDALVAPAFIATVYEMGKWSSSVAEGITNLVIRLYESTLGDGKDIKQFDWVEYDSKPDENYIEKVVRIWWEDYFSLLPHDLKELFDPWRQTYLDELVKIVKEAAGAEEIFDEINVTNLGENMRNETQEYINSHPELSNCGLLATDTMEEIMRKVQACNMNQTPADTTLPAAPTDPNAVSEEMTNAEVDAFINSNLSELKDLIIKPYTVNSDKTVTLYLSGQTEPISILFKVGGKITIKNSN